MQKIRTSLLNKAANPNGSTFIQMRDVLEVLFEDSMFVNLFPPDGQPALAPCLEQTHEDESADYPNDPKAAPQKLVVGMVGCDGE